MKKIFLASLLLILISFAISICEYGSIPSEMAVHWNEMGEEDGHMAKEWGLFLIPATMIFLLLLFLAIPRIDPLRKNIEKFRKYYDGFIFIFLFYLAVIHFQIILWNLGIKMDFNLTMPLLFALLFFYLGILLSRAERNWFVGIRTPWTLSSDYVWKKTHEMGGKLFKIAAIIAVFSIFVRDYAIFIVLIPIFAISLFLVIYSYILWRREEPAKP